MTPSSSYLPVLAAQFGGTLIFIASFISGVPAQPTSDVGEVSVRKPIVQEIDAGKKAAFLLRTESGQSIRGSVMQRGSDVIVRVVPEGARWTAEFDNVLSLESSETFEFVSDDAGSYRIEIEGKSGTPKGSFQLTVNEATAAQERDRKVHKARTLLFEAAALARAGKYTDAIRLGEEVLSIREEVFGPISQDTAIIVNRLGIYHAGAGQAAKAFEFTKRALAIYEAIPQTDPLVLSDVLNNMGVGLRLMGEFAAAESYFGRVLEIRERAFGSEGLPLASTFNNLGLLYRVRGDYEAAERSYTRALRIREKHIAPDHPDIATVLVNLAALAFYKGDYQAAVSLDRRVLDIRKKNLPAGHPSIAEAVYDIALLLIKLGDRENGEKMLLESLALYENAVKPGTLSLAKPLSTLGNFYRESGDLMKARSFIDRALAITRVFEKADPLEHANMLLYSARLHIPENGLAAAEAELTESLAISERILGSEHNQVRETFNTLARLQAIRGNVAKAVEAQSRANQIGERHLAINLNFGTEHQRQSMASMLNSDLEQTLAIHAQLGPADPKLREMAANMLVQRKGRVLDATAGSLSTIRSHLKPEDASLLAQLNDTTAQLSALMVAGPRSSGIEAFNARLMELQERKDEIERDLSRRSSGYFAAARPYSIADVRRMIPADAALIEYAAVRPDFSTKKADNGGRKYSAYIIRREGEIGYVTLGDVTQIDKAVADFRKALRSPYGGDATKLARKVDDLVLRPVRSQVGESTHLLISPEGSLNVVPFEALVDDRGKYAVETYRFTYLTSGRDLFRLGSRPASVEPPVVIADPQFDRATATATSGSRTNATRRGVTSVTTGKQLSDIFFAPLAGSGVEARNIKTIFPNTKLVTGSAATVSSLRALEAPELLHLATHGFFLEDQQNQVSFDGRGADPEPTMVDNPLVRSGLAFAGANERRSEVDDGLLTAMEASGLNLWGTKLVVLSACDTGIGEIRNGEGVYGLRRSFVIAGAESLVMSLWPVSDQVTRELMTAYYQNLKKGLGRGEALRQVRLQMIKRPNRKHPFYWASFIQSGEWANLDGKR